MSRRQVQIVVVCEDRAQEVLLRRYLTLVGYPASPREKKVTFLIAPRGRGSGERYVLTQYAHELTEFRKRNVQYHRLVAVIDADTGTVAEHEDQLAAVAIATGQRPRQQGEQIVHLIPKRNIETWIHRLLRNDATELDNYKQQYARRKFVSEYCRPAADALVALVRDPTETPDLPSLRIGVAELRDKLSGI